MSKLSTSNQALYIGDTLALAARMAQLPVSSNLPERIRNLRTVLMSPENDIVQRRAAFVALERSGEPAAADVLKEFTTSGLTLAAPKVMRPASPNHPEGSSR